MIPSLKHFLEESIHPHDHDDIAILHHRIQSEVYGILDAQSTREAYLSSLGVSDTITDLSWFLLTLLDKGVAVTSIWKYLDIFFIGEEDVKKVFKAFSDVLWWRVLKEDIRYITKNIQSAHRIRLSIEYRNTTFPFHIVSSFPRERLNELQWILHHLRSVNAFCSESKKVFEIIFQ